MKAQRQYFLAQKADIYMFWASQTKGVLAFKEIVRQEYKANSYLLYRHSWNLSTQMSGSDHPSM